MINREKLVEAIPAVARYAAAVLAVVCTLAVRLAFGPFLSDRAPYMFFFITIVVVKRLWGRGPALLATLLGGVSAWYFIVPPTFSFDVANRVDALNLGAYFAVGAGISFLGEVSMRLPTSGILAESSIKVRLFRQTAVLAGAAAVLAGMFVLLLHEFRRSQNAEYWVAHTYRVLNSAGSLLSSVEEAETSQRGFLLTGDETYFTRYKSAVAAVPAGLSELKLLTSDDPRQQGGLVEIGRLAAERLSMLEKGVDLYNHSSFDAARALVRSGQGKQSLDQLRSAVDAFQHEEHDLLDGRQARAQIEASRERWILGLGCGVLIALLVLASVVIERETLRREEIAEDVRRHADLLEQAHDSLLTCRMGGGIGYWSRGAEILFGFAREEAVGRRPHELLQTSHAGGMAQIDALLERDGHWQGDLTQTTKHGRKLTVEAQWTLAVDAHGNKTVLEANRDITEQRRIEEEIRDSEAILRSFFDSAGVMRGIVELIEGRIIHVSCNQAAAQLFGFDRKAITGITAAEAGASEGVVATWVALYERARSTGKPVSGEYARKDAQGRERWLMATASYMGVGRSGNARFAYTILDLTERRSAEEALRQSEAQLRALGDNLPAGAIYRYRRDAGGQPHVDFISAGIEGLTGMPAAEFMADAATVLKSIVPEDRERLNAAIALSAEQMTRFEVEVRHIHRSSGEIRWSLLRSSPTRYPDGSIVWDGIELDITERKRAEAERVLLSTAMEQAAETVVITDPGGKIQYVNPAFTRTTGYSRDEAIGRNPRVLKSGRHDAKFYQKMWASLTAGKIWHGEITNRRKDGTLYVEEATIAPVRDESGKITSYIAIKYDITERKQAEEALHESEMTLRLFVQHAPAAIAMLDTEMRYLEVSHRWLVDYHLGNRELRGLSHYEVFPELPERWKETHQRCLAGAVLRSEEDPLPRSDGSIDWLSWEVRPWRKADETIGGIIIFTELITERKRAQEALQESEVRERARAAEVEALMEAAPVGIFRSDDVDCHWMSGNRAAYDLLRRPRLSNLSKSGPEGEKPVNFRAMKGGTEIPLAELPMQKAAATGQAVRDCEMDFVFEDGVTVNVLGNAVPLLDESGRPRGAMGAFVDITGRKKVEKALEESGLRYRQLFERSESALALHEMVFDAQGNPTDYRFLDVNPAFERHTGLSRSQVVGRSALEVLPELEEYWIKLYGRVAATGEPAVFENYTRTLGRYYAGSAYSLRPNQFAVSFMDITERKRAEEELRLLNVELEERVRTRTTELQAANRELEAFAHSVSHDLRAPLRGIDGWSLALLEDCGDRLDAQGHKYLERVRSEAQRMGTLIDDLLRLSRVSRTEMVLTTVDLTALARTIAARLKEALPGRCIEFIVAPELKCTGDPRLIEVALTNLLGNAAKFTGTRTCAKVEFGETEREGTPVFFVRDNGVGFDMAYAKMLFAPFQRLHKASEFPGTGIGLATVQRVIHRHGGRIRAEAKVGGGATFYFTLGAVNS